MKSKRLPAKIIGWDFLHLICKHRMEEMCKGRIREQIDKGAGLIDSDLKCTPMKCPFWEQMKDDTTRLK